MRHKEPYKESYFDVKSQFDVDYDLLYIITDTHICEDGKISFISSSLNNESISELKWFREVIKQRSDKPIDTDNISVIRLAGFDLSGKDGISRDLLEFCKSFDTDNTIIYSVLEVKRGGLLPIHLLKYFAMSKFYAGVFGNRKDKDSFAILSVFMNNFATRYISNTLIEKNFSYIMN